MHKLLILIFITTLPGLPNPARAAKLDPSHYELIDRANLSDDEVNSIERRLNANYRKTLAFVGGEGPSPRIEYTIYDSFEGKGLATQDMRVGHVDYEAEAVHVVINDWIRGDDSLLDSRLLIRKRLGEPSVRLLEIGLAVYFSQDWRGKGYEYWASRLYASGNTPPLADLLDNETMRHESYLVVQPFAGTFVAYAIDTFGRDVFLNEFAGWQADPGEIASLERGWHKHLDALVSKYEADMRRDRNAFPRRPGFQKGFCHAHEGYQIFNGYGSRKSDAALRRLDELGTNAVSITPFTYMRDPHEPVRFRFSNEAGAENDESVIHSARTAHELGMRVMLKPHVWLGRSWPGAIEMRSDDDWDKWFRYYYSWILHYALLGEMYNIEILCIGVELSKATVGHEDRWQHMIARLRGLYSGEMTYAANWGEEFENVAIWRDLDFIGINCYYPLSESDAPTHEELCRGAQAVVDRVEAVYKQYHKPVIFTEIGFSSTPKPWMQPHEPRIRVVNLDHQTMCYEAIFATLHGKKWCNGIYWWKWPTVLEYGGKRHTGFTPNQKPAEDIIRKWYERAW